MPPPITAALSAAPFIVTSPQSLRRCQPVKEGSSRSRSANLGAADEVDKVVAGIFRRSLAEALRPGIERIGRIAIGLVIGATPQMGIDEIRGDLEVGAAVVDDERHLMQAEELDDGSGGDPRAAKFDDMPQGAAVDVTRQQFEKRGERAFIDRHVRGELPQDRPELVAQLDDAARDEALENRPGTGEIGAVRRDARPFEREDEILRRLVVPAAEARRLLRTVEGAVDFDRRELAAGIADLARLRQAPRVEDAAPRRKDPAADPDADLPPGAHPCSSTGNSRKDGVPSAFWTVLVATRMSSSPSSASTGWPLLVLRARRGKLLLVTSTSMRWPAGKVWWMWPRSMLSRSTWPGTKCRGSPDGSRYMARVTPSISSIARPSGSSSISLATKSVSVQFDWICKVRRTLPAIVSGRGNSSLR